MNLLSLVLYGALNLAMIICYFGGRGRYYQFPFWAGAIGMGFFFPQALGMLNQRTHLPESAYWVGMLFASLCTAAMWWGFVVAYKAKPNKTGWIQADFDIKKLYYAGAFLCLFGFFFQWKLANLPEEMLASTQWSGATVKYLFLASVFKFGFITLWMLYIYERKWFSPRFLIFLVPSMMLLLNAAVLLGRRAEMMGLFSFIFVSLWFVRRVSFPRWMLICGLGLGLILINAIGLYRGLMSQAEGGVLEKLSMAADADYVEEARRTSLESTTEVRNYLTYRQIYDDEGIFDYGIVHWNLLIFNYVPAQIVGRGLKTALMMPLKDYTVSAQENYGHVVITGATASGYLDAYGSFGWFGFIKFLLVGLIMGALYRHAMTGAFLAQLLYVYGLSTAMHVVTHQTNDILVRIWIYFFALGYPIIYLSKIKTGQEAVGFENE